jgi:NADP-dependent 3-hydroxy acid dehydrogenase YdfG
MSTLPVTRNPAPITLPLPSALTGAATLVVGGSAGIGLGVARLLRSVGAEVTIAARDGDRLRAAAAGIDGSVRTVEADVSDPSSLDALFSVLGELDHVYVAAGTYRSAPWSTRLPRTSAAALTTGSGGRMRSRVAPFRGYVPVDR